MAELGVIKDYRDLHQILRARCEQLDILRETIDDASGLTSGHASKLLADPPIKNLGIVSLGLVLGALGMKLIAVDDHEALERIRPKLVRRRGNNRRGRSG
jgi:hypothetical protein